MKKGLPSVRSVMRRLSGLSSMPSPNNADIRSRARSRNFGCRRPCRAKCWVERGQGGSDFLAPRCRIVHFADAKIVVQQG
jgi:hypothetical protein